MKRILDPLRPLAKFIRSSYFRFIFRTYWLCWPNNPGVNISTCHFLVVKDKSYASLVQTAVESLLFHNSQMKVVVHCDSVTYSKTRKRLFLVSLKNRQKVHVVHSFSYQNWQTSKLELILSLNGTNDIFLDADTRVNASLPALTSTFFLVKDRPFHRDLVSRINASLDSNFTDDLLSKNTTAFGWCGYSLTQDDIDFARKLFNFLLTELRGQPTERLCEQFTMSLLVEHLQIRCEYIKLLDRQFDKAVIESSYFGATSSRFF